MIVCIFFFCQVWFVSKHQNVNWCMQRINHACTRTVRHSHVEVVQDVLQLEEDTVLVAPTRNVPLKLYTTQKAELLQLCDTEWRAPLRLNQREKAVRLHEGMVLLLGRSGTGKTLCLIDRMRHDRRKQTTSS